MPAAEDFRTWVRCPPPPPMQPSRTALRGFDELEDLEGGLGLVVGFSYIRRNRDQPDRSEELPKLKRRSRGLGFEHRLKRDQAASDPFNWRRLEHGLIRGFIGLELKAQFGRLLFGRPESLPQGPAALAVADELNVVGDPTLFRDHRRPLDLDLFGQVGLETLHLCLDSAEHVSDRSKIPEALLNRSQDCLLGGPSGHEEFVLTGATGSTEATVVTTALATHQANVASAHSTVKGS